MNKRSPVSTVDAYIVEYGHNETQLAQVQMMLTDEDQHHLIDEDKITRED